MLRMVHLLFLFLGVWRLSDAAPQFTQESMASVDYALTHVREDLVKTDGIGKEIGTLTCVDTERPGDPLSITLVNGRTYISFVERLSYARIRVIKVLNYENLEDQNSKSILIQCTNLITQATVFFESKLIIIDANDVAPVFQRNEGEVYELKIDEILTGTLPIRLNYTKITVFDGDGSVRNQKVTAKCVSMLVAAQTISCDGYFSVREEAIAQTSNQYRFIIYAERRVYVEKSYVLRIRAENYPELNDTGDVPLFSPTQSVSIIINDIQNSPPYIRINRLQFQIYEDHPVGTSIGLPVQAYDQDRGDPHAINFTLRVYPRDTYGFDNGFFRLEPTQAPSAGGIDYSASMTLMNSIDREAIPGTSDIVYVNLVAQEYDLQNRPNRNTSQAVATISVLVLDRNDERPLFGSNNYSRSLPEITGSIPIEQQNDLQQILAGIEVVDRDRAPYNSFRVEFASGNENGIFSLDKYNGTRNAGFILYAKKSTMDYESHPVNTYRLVLRAIDLDRPDLSSTTVVNVQIIDSNDNRPRFNQSGYSFSLPENSPLNTFIGRVFATDGDAGDTVTYSLGGETRFYITQNGSIYLNGTVDYETRSSYQVAVIARDTADHEEQVIVSIAIGNVNDVGPRFPLTGYVALLYEESTQLNPEIVLQATYAESNQQIIYGIGSVSPAVLTSYFKVDPISGRLRVLRDINYKQTEQGAITLEFTATADGLVSTTSGIITVLDINNFAPQFQPNFTTRYTTVLTELAQPGDHVYTMSVIDSDGPETDNGRVVFQIIEGSYDNFNIGFDTGEIVVATRAQLDVDSIPQYTLLVKARDLGNPVKSATATLVVQLMDANNKPPVFNETIIGRTVKEGTAIGTPITRVFATDPDADSMVRYSLSFTNATYQRNSEVVGTYINGSQYFSIDPQTGILRLAGNVQRSIFDRVFFKIIAEDMNVTQDQPRQIAIMDIRITILASDEQRIYFNTDQGPVINPTLTKDFPETDSGQAVAQIFSLQAIDPNVSREISIYEELPGYDSGDYLGVNERFVYLKKNLDYEALPGGPVKQISTVVLAVSNDRLRTGTATCIVYVLDINDNSPRFEEREYPFEVDELKIHPWRIGSVKATDADSSSYGQVTYSLSGANSDHFQIFTEVSGGSNIGVIRIAPNTTLDYETNALYNLQVIARDNPSGDISERLRATVPIQIRVKDANDNPPIFRERVYNFTVVGTIETGGAVGIIIADDLDQGKNGEVEYYIQSSTSGGTNYFNIRTEPRNSAQPGEKFYVGQLYVKRALDALPDLSRFEMTVLARDNVGRSPQLTGTTRVIITVSKGVRDPKPKWDDGLPSTVYIREDSKIDDFVAQLTARPANDSSGIIYSFVTAGAQDYKKFKLDPDNGRITVNATLNYNVQSVFNLLVLASDTTNLTYTNQFLLVVRLIDVNNHQPSFTSCPGKTYPIPVITSVREALQPPVFVYQAVACDLDPVAYNAMRYTWYFDSTYCNSEIARVFNLDEDDGTISTNITLDREVTPEYLVCVQVSERPQTDSNRKKRDMVSDLRARDNHDKVLYVRVIVEDVNDMRPTFRDHFLQTVILEYPPVSIGVAEAFDPDQSPNNEIRYSIDSIEYTRTGEPQSHPAAFSINGDDGTIVIGLNDYSGFVGGYFEIIIRASDARNGDMYDRQTQRVYVTKKENQVRVVIDRPADEGVETLAINMVNDLNGLNRMFYQIKKISYHIIDNEQDPSFSKTDVCMVVLRRDKVLSETEAVEQLNSEDENEIIQRYGARDPGSCDPAQSVYPEGWESYWWVLVAFAIFIFILVLILIVLIIILHRQYKNYMDTRKTYLVQGN